MFRLLAILVALHFSSKADGSPHNASLEGGKRIPTRGILDRYDIASGLEPLSSNYNPASQEKKDQALNQVQNAKFFLQLPRADPYNDEALAKLLGSAVKLYCKAFERPLPTSPFVSDYVKAFNEILEEIEPEEPAISALNTSGSPDSMPDGKITETDTYQLIKWLRESGIVQRRRRGRKEPSD